MTDPLEALKAVLAGLDPATLATLIPATAPAPADEKTPVSVKDVFRALLISARLADENTVHAYNAALSAWVDRVEEAITPVPAIPVPAATPAVLIPAPVA